LTVLDTKDLWMATQDIHDDHAGSV